ncbi:MAG: DUF1460 domain-containing protein [Bacteroidaceae bacterium]|nr:DUF1460 domain-containing protein [Bacteroidaceae bacterium]
MKPKHLLLLPLLCIACSKPTAAQPLQSPADSTALSEVVYTPADSAEVVSLLATEVEGDTVLYYARHFLGRPYVGHTLEVHDPEYLVVNLRELDCTTLVETVLALAVTKARGGTSFADYCRTLEQIRYRDGRRGDYTTRLHYYTWWKHDNERKSLVRTVTGRPFTAPMAVSNTYMSQHPDRYAMLSAHPEFVPVIARMERAENGRDGTYLPTAATGRGRAALNMVGNGDIIGIVKMQGGIDISHLGFAVWGSDNKLHLLNASSLHKRVVEEPMTLQEYLQRQKRPGIQVLHPCLGAPAPAQP